MPTKPVALTTAAAWFAARGDPTRLAVVRALVLAQKPLDVGAVADAVGASSASASNHLRKLLRAGLATAQRDGLHNRYALVGAAVDGGVLTLTHPAGLRAVVPLG